MLWEVERILDEKFQHDPSSLPKYLLLENVKNIISNRHINAYNQWIDKIKSLGYIFKTYVLNSADFGCAQSRTRVFCISVRHDILQSANFCFPDFSKDKKINHKNLAVLW